MSARNVRIWNCDSCTTEKTVDLAPNMPPVPTGWVQVDLTSGTNAQTRYWCTNCIQIITDHLPNALGEHAAGWPHVQRSPEPICVNAAEHHLMLSCGLCDYSPEVRHH